MDTFIDKLAQKRNAQEMIRANTTAETLKMEQMQKQMEAYDGLLQEIRKVNLKTAENAAQVQNVLRECLEKLERVQTDDGQTGGSEQTLEEIKKLLQDQFQQSNDFLHKENVKVYRNVQAALIEELNKQTEELKNSQAQNKTNKAILPVCVLILIGVIADIMIGLLPGIMNLF